MSTSSNTSSSGSSSWISDDSSNFGVPGLGVTPAAWRLQLGWAGLNGAAAALWPPSKQGLYERQLGY